jgi:hypothetical protein
MQPERERMAQRTRDASPLPANGSPSKAAPSTVPPTGALHEVIWPPWRRPRRAPQTYGRRWPTWVASGLVFHAAVAIDRREIDAPRGGCWQERRRDRQAIPVIRSSSAVTQLLPLRSAPVAPHPGH